MQAPTAFSFARLTERPIGQNNGMPKADIRQILADNLAKTYPQKGFESKASLAHKAGISTSTLSEIMRGLTSATIDTVNNLAFVLGVQPWELLADSESTKQAAMMKMLWGEAATDKEVEKHLPLPPKPTVKKTRKKRGPTA